MEAGSVFFSATAGDSGGQRFDEVAVDQGELTGYKNITHIFQRVDFVYMSGSSAGTIELVFERMP